MENEKTPYGLPRITKKTYRAFIQEFNRDFSEGRDEYLEQKLEEIYNENPVFYRMINMFADRFPEYENMDKKAALALISAYRLLKLQAGNDMVNETWFPKECNVDGISFIVPSKLLESLGWGDGDDLEGEVLEDSLIIKRIKKEQKPQTS